MNIWFCPKNQKSVLQKEVKDWTFEAYLLTEEAFLDCSDGIIDNDSCQILCVVLNFLDCFSWYVLPKLIKIADLSKVTRKKRIGSILTCHKLANWISTLNCSKSAKWIVWKSIYLQSLRSLKHHILTVGKSESVPLGTPSQEVVISLAHKWRGKSLYLELQRGYCYKFWAVQATQ